MADGYLRFLRAFLKEPHLIGSVVPSSRELAEMMLEQIDLKPQSRVAEIGPGTGSITEVILERLENPGQYFGVDINPDFVEKLRAHFPGAAFTAGSAENLRKFLAEGSNSRVDHIISSLPWTIFPAELREKTLRSVLASLEGNGTFTTFTYVHASWLPRGRTFLGQLHEYFQEVLQSPVVWGNLPPAIVWHARGLKAKL